MDFTSIPLWITEAEYLFWITQAFAFVIAAVFFVRADRRSHTICFLVGSVLGLVLVLWQSYDYSALVGWLLGDEFKEASELYFTLQSGLAILANGLMAYGMVMIGLITFRKRRAPQIDSAPDEE